MKRINKEKVLISIVTVMILAVVTMVSNKLDKEFIKGCTSKGYSESYCLAKA